MALEQVGLDKEPRRAAAGPVSYTHLDVYKRQDLNITDCIVGVFYGTESSLSQSYKRIDEEYPVYVGLSLIHI